MDAVTRAQVEDFLYEEAALLDAWKVDGTLFTNVRILERGPLRVQANFIVYRYRRRMRWNSARWVR